jgi:L-alanine-DL-glutamate epimerase-like enolase superfamily enzyme
MAAAVPPALGGSTVAAGARVDAGVVEAVEITPLAVPLKRPMIWAGGRDEHAVQLLVEIHTDAGLTGIGECMAALDAAVVHAAARHFAAMIIGQPVTDLMGTLPSRYARGRWQYFRQLAHYALCGLDIALWDIAGKAAGVPVHELLGESVRARIDHFYWLHRGGTPHDLVTQAGRGLATGHQVFYVKAGIDETAAEVIAAVTAVRDAIGPAPLLRVDANQAWTLEEALQILDALAGSNLDWIEEPVSGASPADLHRIREQLGLRVAVDQGAWLPETMLELAAAGAIDVVCTDPSRHGGLGEFLWVADALDRFGVEICRHCGNEFGVFLAASLHACASVTNLCVGNQYCDQLSWDVIADDLHDAAGAFKVPTRPGLGITLDDARVAAAREYYERSVAA